MDNLKKNPLPLAHHSVSWRTSIETTCMIFCSCCCLFTLAFFFSPLSADMEWNNVERERWYRRSAFNLTVILRNHHQIGTWKKKLSEQHFLMFVFCSWTRQGRRDLNRPPGGAALELENKWKQKKKKKTWYVFNPAALLRLDENLSTKKRKDNVTTTVTKKEKKKKKKN